jgi:Flp pilus assembly pilin Flp
MCTIQSCRAKPDRAAGQRPERASRGLSRTRSPLVGDRAGVTAIEYALMGALIAGVIAGAVSGYTGGLGALMTRSFGTIAGAM